MKVILQASVPTHHNSTDLRGLNLKHYKSHGSGVHESWEAFKTMKEAREHLKDREVDVPVKFLTGWEMDEYIQSKEDHNVEWN